MSTVNKFLDKKKANSPFLSLADGESVKILEVKAIEMKTIPNTYKAGETKDVLSLMVEVDTTEGKKVKEFQNGTPKFAKALADKDIDVGSSFTMVREGEMAKTQYILLEVVNKPKIGTAPATPAPVSAPAGATPNATI